ncbi:hypothetical protein N3K66_004561 [Trichothecium roseum]|uniref:Uncharacterized protein n=1 Tax=Trichothecium roseum TaxID=47278 RepID=A0ACC0V1M2_9HYPO|nr:hypothetical protein N3K66_004561 [Trichothecium roseum]
MAPNGIVNGKTIPSALLESFAPNSRHVFIQPDSKVPTDSLNLVKATLEQFAGQVADEQQQRFKENRKRKRGGEKGEILKARKIYLDGFETNQVWQQAKRIIGGVLKYSDEVLDDLQDKGDVIAAASGTSEEDNSDSELEGSAESQDESGSQVSLDDEREDELEEESMHSDAELDDLEDEWEDAPEGDALVGDDKEGEDEDEDEDEDEADEEFVEDPDGLNDGFFSIDEFNRQSQYFEDQDARGDPNTDRADEEGDIDWTADPFSASTKAAKGHENDDISLPDAEAEESDEDGPTFGNMDLNAPEGASDDEAEDDMDENMEDGGMEMNANDVYYKDFFAPPPRKNKGGNPKKTAKFEHKRPDDTEVERAMANVRRDLFEDESENDSEDALSDVSAGDPRSRRSAHERRQAKLAEEIRKLEAASVAKREWAMSGEAVAVDRPMNSLLEEDLDFEHAGKPIPVITPEVSESIEELIKRRILAMEFDEVIRRRPDSDMPVHTRRGMLEQVDDTKGKSLAEVYEEEHAREADPDAYVSKSDEKLQREEKEIEAMWKTVSARLDALSSWQYRPKPVAPAISVVADVGTVSMEDAQPTTAQGMVGESSRMAPQEIYSASGKDAEKGEVVTKGGMPLAKQELSREDKTRRRRREKERVRKAGGVGTDKPVSKRAQMQKDTMADLKKGGVRVINRKGEVTDLEGKKAKKQKALTSGNFKL